MRRFLTDEVFHESHDKVARAKQSDREEEANFTERIAKDGRLCHHVFSKDELINCYTQGLRTADREIVSDQLRKMPLEGQRSLSVVYQVAVSVGRGQRAP